MAIVKVSEVSLLRHVYLCFRMKRVWRNTPQEQIAVIIHHLKIRKMMQKTLCNWNEQEEFDNFDNNWEDENRKIDRSDEVQEFPVASTNVSGEEKDSEYEVVSVMESAEGDGGVRNAVGVSKRKNGNSSPILFTKYGPGTIVEDVEDVDDVDGREIREGQLYFEEKGSLKSNELFSTEENCNRRMFFRR